ncbi:fetuin B [Solea solea]|uniref:fetuin B n=1 Tax=Solea solea TaxID=90069 RepID=UPI0027298A3C|nr:fetuin B [Solea solea]
MKHCVWLLLALGCVHVHGAPVESVGLEQGSCTDAFALSAAKEALTKINQDRQDGYIFSLHGLYNVYIGRHAETGVVFYLTLDVVETNCSVLNKRDDKNCEARPTDNTPVYGQCKAVIYFDRPQRVVRLMKYDCQIRPVPAGKISEQCPDCPTLWNNDDPMIQKTVSESLEKFNKDSGLKKRFALLKVARSTASMGMATFYNAEYTIQETTCVNSADAVAADKCPLMDCEFAHKGFCKASHHTAPDGEEGVTVECEIYEPEAGEREKKQHLLGGETDHSHNDTKTHNHDHDHAHATDHAHTHDHVHDHTKSHAQHVKTHTHDNDSDHHHTHDHDAGSAHRHAHAHSHDHGHGHDHDHAHHAKAHNHSGDSENHHHDYKHADTEHTHEHDHELALDHDHKHGHLHEHEHHHHHHGHDHETAHHDHPEGTVVMLPSVDKPVTLPFFPEKPHETGVTLPSLPDPQIPGQSKLVIEPFPTSLSAQCVQRSGNGSLVDTLFTEDPRFKADAVCVCGCYRMSVYLLILCLALLHQEGRATPDAPSCVSPEAVRVAEETLEQINQDRTNGYILSLNRLYDLSHTPDTEKDGSLYKLTIDVMETKCHIASKKPWKQCEVRDISDVPVYGECEVSAFVDTRVKLQSYSCVLREVPATAVVGVCPDCPTADNMNEPVVKETATLSLQRFNEESRLANYFTLERITRASSQWVVGPSYFVEFTIVETVCSKGTDASEMSSCPPMDCQFAHRGFCLGSHMAHEDQFEIRPMGGKKGSSFQDRKPVEVKCEIYEPQAATVEEHAHAKADAEHTGHQHHNHTHLHPHEHVHTGAAGSDVAVSMPKSSLGTVVHQPAPARSSPKTSSCPGPRRHNLGLDRLKL